MRTQARFWRACAGLLFLSCGPMLAGCGAATGTVSGKVTYDGKALKGGNVSFVSKAGGVASGAIQEDGSYTVAKVPLGPAAITVETKSLRPVAKQNLPGPYKNIPADQLPPNMKQAEGDPSRYVPIPDGYSDPGKSGLSLDVMAGPQTHNIELK